MSQPEPNRDSEAFLSALADQLPLPPPELIAKHHVAAAATVVASRQRPAALRRVTSVAAACAVFALLGTGGMAVAGALPDPVQGFVADMARALPVPIRVPHPDQIAQSPAQERVSPQDGEVEVADHVTSHPSPPVTAPAEEPLPIEPEVPDRATEGQGTCDVSDVEAEGGRLDADSWAELAERFERECGLELVAPPRFTDGDTESGHRDLDRERSWQDGQEWGENGGDQDGTDVDRSGDERSDRSRGNDREGQEDRDQDREQRGDRGSGNRWGHGRD